MQRKLMVIGKVCLFELAFLMLAETHVAHAQPGFGQQWQKSGAPLFGIIGPPGSWNGVPIPAVDIIGHVMFDGAQYKAYIAGFDGAKFAAGLWTSATLESGWAAHPGNPVLTGGLAGSWDEFEVGNPMVIIDEGTFKMWYAGYDSSDVYRIGYATSADGVAWTKFVNNPVLDVSANGWDSYHLHTPYVIKDGGTFRMWYAGHDTSFANWAIGYATSPDGIAWTRASGTPVLAPEAGWEIFAIHTPTVILENGNFLMWYGGHNEGAGEILQTGFAISEDGLNWVKDASNPVLPAGGAGALDTRVALALGVFKANATTYKMLYGASNVSTFFGGMLATLNLPTSVTETGSLPTDFALQQSYPNPFSAKGHGTFGNPETVISYELPVAGEVWLTIFNALGQEIRTLVNSRQSPGQKLAVWDGKNDHGQSVNAGIYFYTLKAGNRVQTKKMVLMR